MCVRFGSKMRCFRCIGVRLVENRVCYARRLECSSKVDQKLVKFRIGGLGKQAAVKCQSKLAHPVLISWYNTKNTSAFKIEGLRRAELTAVPRFHPSWCEIVQRYSIGQIEFHCC
ncbi:MAG: hypothetical protein ACKESB_00975 [Candidatus Hodgkinia cicadicola]